MPNYETFKLCGFEEILSRPCMKEQPCRKHDDYRCCACGDKATHICESMTLGSHCGGKLCNKCEHLGEVHVRKIQITRKITMELSITVDNNNYRSGKLQNVIKSVVENAVDLHCGDMISVNSIEVE